MTTPTIVGIVSIVIGFALIGASFYVTSRTRNVPLAVGLGIAAFVFITVIPVVLAVFIAAPNPGV
ncbi:hypothetical protein [Corynebacterium timonense]|uniref:Uncharacterized protein n=1 Tax=Corynebacterium timonense TaxID=441500 RepID=A0A1H1UT60_9CORY|nr:hypothetical protein [Corynebacterium timonense]SDS75768.1 hypothetical protein SAMN04488539_2326 [Corynebacterium timonense]